MTENRSLRDRCHFNLRFGKLLLRIIPLKMEKRLYINRTDAGRYLADQLKKYKGTDSIVLAIPRGGVPVACAIAETLQLPLDLLLVKKIGHPANPEYAIGAASLYDYFVPDSMLVSPQYIESAVEEIRKRLRASRNEFMKGMPLLSLMDKNIIIVDDGLATGQTLLAAVKLVKLAMPRKITVCVPVASQSGVTLLKGEADELVVPFIPDNFCSVGDYYADFSQVSDDEVKRYLEGLRKQHHKN